MSKKIAPKVTVGKYLMHVHFDGMTWPLPSLELMSRMHDSADPVRVAAASVLRAYHQMVWDSQPKRQRVIRHLRAARLDRASAPKEGK